MQPFTRRTDVDPDSQAPSDEKDPSTSGMVFIVDSERSRSESLIQVLKRAHPTNRYISLCMEIDSRPVHGDVRIVNLGGLVPAALGELLGRTANSPEAATVYWADDPASPQVCAARALGISRIVPARELNSWLIEALPALVWEGRSLRLLRASQQAMPSIPSWPDRSGANRLGLAQAETMFRETYLAAVLMESDSCRRAAEAARVPYRTFYDMVKKLGLA
jgi:hypothetical protein